MAQGNPNIAKAQKIAAELKKKNPKLKHREAIKLAWVQIKKDKK